MSLQLIEIACPWCRDGIPIPTKYESVRIQERSEKHLVVECFSCGRGIALIPQKVEWHSPLNIYVKINPK